MEILADVGAVPKNDAGGYGLFRSEFLYLESDTYPTEEQQFAVYKKVAETMAGKKVIIRTLDIGADKQVDYFKLDKEDNPALGYRAIRICLTRPEIFKTQLRAALSCIRLWTDIYYVPDDYFGSRSKENQRNRRGSQSRTSHRRSSFSGRCRTWNYD